MLTAPLSERNHPVARKVTSSTALVLLLGLAACTNSYDPGQRAVGGGLIGAGTGAASWRWPRGGDRCRRRRRLGRHHRCTDNASAASLLTPAVQGGSCIPASRGRCPGKSLGPYAWKVCSGDPWLLQREQNAGGVLPVDRGTS